MAADADRHLLFGLIALQVGLVDQAQLVAAFQAWARDKARPLDDHLTARGDLDDEGRDAVAAMVALHLRRNGGDTEKSLASLPAGRSTRERLAALGDPELTAIVANLGPGSTEPDVESTRSYAVGSATADGQRFRVLRPHAKGGLGAVFVALDDELHREVALKQILDDHADDPVSRRRFLREAEITGGLEHPGIVPVYGLGHYADGRPYYAMRFVRGDSLGESIARFHAAASPGADPGTRSLELRKLLRRFLDVCNAIAYAHGRGVLHRDIKPGNIIVGKYGETLVVDWGLAKARGQGDGPDPAEERPLVPSSASGAAETLPGQALGTPAYMSPEQARGDLEALGPASDVYALGATLYCLLTGHAPLEGDVADVLRAVGRGDFRPPRQLDPRIDPALEAVCLRAMATRPEGRYASCRALAEDVERWMADEPVSAWREPLASRSRRWMRRHRAWVSGAAILIVTATAATAAGLVLLGRKNLEISAAADQAAAVNAFLTEDLLGQADPDVNDRDKKVTVEDLLHRAGAKMEGNAKFFGRPEVEATLRLTLGKTFFKLSNLAEAEKHLTRSMKLRREALGREHPLTLDAQEALADLLMRGSARFAETEQLARRTWQARARVLGPRHPDTLDSLDTYAGALRGLGRVAEAVPLYRECLEARRRLLGMKHADTLTTMNNLANALASNGDWAEALPLIRGVLEVYREVGPETDHAGSATILALALYMNGDLEEADGMLRGAVDRATVRLGAEDLRTTALRGWQVRVWIDQGRLESAVALGRDVLAVKRRSYPAGHPSVGYSLADLGRGLVSLERFAEAEPLLAESRSIFSKAPPPIKYYPAWAECWHGGSMVGLGRYAEAEPLLLDAERKLRGSPTATRRHHREAEEQLVRLYRSWDKPEQAAKWSGELEKIR